MFATASTLVTLLRAILSLMTNPANYRKNQQKQEDEDIASDYENQCSV